MVQGSAAQIAWAETAPVSSLPANAYRPPPHPRQCLGVDCRLLLPGLRGRPSGWICSPVARTLAVGCCEEEAGAIRPLWLRASTRNWFDRTERFDYVGFPARGGSRYPIDRSRRQSMIGFLIRAAIVAVGLWLAHEDLLRACTSILRESLIAAALLLGLVNAVIRPIAIILTFPLTLRDARILPAGGECRDAGAGRAVAGWLHDCRLLDCCWRVRSSSASRHGWRPD